MMVYAIYGEYHISVHVRILVRRLSTKGMLLTDNGTPATQPVPLEKDDFLDDVLFPEEEDESSEPWMED